MTVMPSKPGKVPILSPGEVTCSRCHTTWQSYDEQQLFRWFHTHKPCCDPKLIRRWWQIWRH